MGLCICSYHLPMVTSLIKIVLGTDLEYLKTWIEIDVMLFFFFFFCHRSLSYSASNSWSHKQCQTWVRLMVCGSIQTCHWLAIPTCFPTLFYGIFCREPRLSEKFLLQGSVRVLPLDALLSQRRCSDKTLNHPFLRIFIRVTLVVTQEFLLDYVSK